MLHGERVRGAVGVVGDRHEVHVGEVEAFFGAVVDAFAGQEAVQVHLAEADGVALLIGAANRRHRVDAGVLGHRGECADRRLHRVSQAAIHRLGDVERTQIAGDVAADMRIREVLVVCARLLNLQDFRAQVGHGHAAFDRVRAVDRVLEHDVRVAGFELQFGDGGEELTGVDVGLLDAVVGHHLVIMLGNGDVGERLAVHALHVVRAEQGHLGLLLGQFERDVRNHHAKSQRLDADLLVRVLSLGVQEAQDVRVVGVEVHRARALTRAELVGVGEGILQQLHNRNHATGLVFDVLDRSAELAQVAQQQSHATAALGELEGRVDAARNRLHVVFDAHQEAADRFATLGLAEVQEGRGGGLEAAGKHFVGVFDGLLLIAGGELQGHSGATLREVLKIEATIERLERVGRVELERTKESAELKAGGFHVLVDAVEEFSGVLVEDRRVVVLVADQVFETLGGGGEPLAVGGHVPCHVFAFGGLVFVELDLAVGVIEVEHRVERVVIVRRVVLFRCGVGSIVERQAGGGEVSHWKSLEYGRSVFTQTVAPPSQLR